MSLLCPWPAKNDFQNNDVLTIYARFSVVIANLDPNNRS